MAAKEPVVLVMVVDAARLRWLVSAVGLDGAATPLVRSADGDLATCRGLAFDEQVSFLRHRLCGVLQRGCDRLWPVGRKAGQFAVVFTADLPGTTRELTRRVAEHFAEWLLSPPAVVYFGDAGERLAGSIDAAHEQALGIGLPAVFAAAADDGAWEESTRKGTWQPAAGDEG
jgi:hypothetical protein